LVVASAKFTHGAWMVLLLIPFLMYGSHRVSRHYRGLARALALDSTPSLPRAIRQAVLVLVPGIHRGIIPALVYAKTISPDPEAVFVAIHREDTPALREAWHGLGLGLPLTVLESPWRSLSEPIIRYTRTLRAERHMDMVTVIIPEFEVTHFWQRLLHNQDGLLLKFALMFEPGVVVVNIRYRPDYRPDE
jgi:hypothetical protein